jgi:hypothetical protein
MAFLTCWAFIDCSTVQRSIKRVRYYRLLLAVPLLTSRVFAWTLQARKRNVNWFEAAYMRNLLPLL